MLTRYHALAQKFCFLWCLETSTHARHTTTQRDCAPQWRMTHDISRYRISRKCIWWTMNDDHSSNKGNTNVRATVNYWPLMTRSNVVEHGLISSCLTGEASKYTTEYEVRNFNGQKILLPVIRQIKKQGGFVSFTCECRHIEIVRSFTRHITALYSYHLGATYGSTGSIWRWDHRQRPRQQFQLLIVKCLYTFSESTFGSIDQAAMSRI